MSSPSSPQRTSIPPDQATTFPVETLTESQQEVFTRYIDAKREAEKGLREPIWFALVLAGRKPAINISILSESEDTSTSITAEEIAESFDLIYRKYQEDIDVVRSSWRLELLPSKKEDVSASSYFRRLGCFYGYPEQDTIYFIENSEWDTSPPNLVEEGIISPNEAAYMVFLPQRYNVSEQYERAIESGKQIRKTISECSKRWNFSYIDEHTEGVYQRALEECIP